MDFFVDFEFRSAILQKLIGLVFHEAMLRIVRAFERRAEALYGAPRQRLKRELERGLDAARAHRAAAERRRSRGARRGSPPAVAMANQTSPSGFASEAPGPATPVTATASSASDAASAPSAMARATGSDTAPCAASIACGTPSIAILAG